MGPMTGQKPAIPRSPPNERAQQGAAEGQPSARVLFADHPHPHRPLAHGAAPRPHEDAEVQGADDAREETELERETGRKARLGAWQVVEGAAGDDIQPWGQCRPKDDDVADPRGHRQDQAVDYVSAESAPETGVGHAGSGGATCERRLGLHRRNLTGWCVNGSRLGLMTGAAETETFWLEFCRSLIRRGLRWAQLVISDAHEELRSALAQCFAGATWQRCRVHFLRNIGTAVPKAYAPAVLAVTRTIFSQPTAEAAHEAVSHALQLFEPRLPKAAELLRNAEADVLTYMAFPADHWRSISSTNAIERLNAEIDRRAKVVGIFTNTASLLRLATAVVQDQHDEWQDDRRLFSQHSIALLLHADGPRQTRAAGPASQPRKWRLVTSSTSPTRPLLEGM
jgi:hypothetical protein